MSNCKECYKCIATNYVINWHYEAVRGHCALYFPDYKHEIMIGTELIGDLPVNLTWHEKLRESHSGRYTYFLFPKMENMVSEILDIYQEKGRINSFCYLEIAKLLYERYNEEFEKIIKYPSNTESGGKQYFLDMLYLLFGEPDANLNYLKYILGYDNRNLKMYWMIFLSYYGVENDIQKIKDDVEIFYKRREEIQKYELAKEKEKEIQIRFIEVLNKFKYKNNIVENRPPQKIRTNPITRKRKSKKEERNSYYQKLQKKILLKQYGGCVVCGIRHRTTLENCHIKPFVDSDESEEFSFYNGFDTMSRKWTLQTEIF